MKTSILGRVSILVLNARDSLWLLPSAMVVAIAGLAVALLRLDTHLDRLGDPVWWLFQGNADSARTILSVIAGSLISVVAVAFSITTIAIQQAATQYSPRILRNFTRDRGNQVVLGAYIGTFVYALLVLRRVRESVESLDTFIPAISITTAVALAIVSLGLLVYFIHHVTRSLQVSVLLSSLGRDLRHEFQHHFPERVGRPVDDARTDAEILEELRCDATKRELTIDSPGHGYLRLIDARGIEAAVRNAHVDVFVLVGTGEYLQRNQAIVRLFAPDSVAEHRIAAVRGAFSSDETRSVEQDPMFGIQQISDVALKALSPGINDPRTAIQCLDELGNALSVLLERDLPQRERRIGGSRVIFQVPGFADYVDAAFGAVGRAARTEPRVSAHLIRVLGKLIQRCGSGGRLDALRAQVEEVSIGAEWDDFTPREQQKLRDELTEARSEITRASFGGGAGGG